MRRVGWSNRGVRRWQRLLSTLVQAYCKPMASWTCAALRKLVFANPEQRRWLESLLHPLIGQEIVQVLARAESPYAILVSPLLVESGQRQMTQRILVVDTPAELQVQRTIARDQSSEEQVRAIMQAQASREERLRHAHDVLVNDRDMAWLDAEVERLHNFYLTLRGGQP